MIIKTIMAAAILATGLAAAKGAAQAEQGLGSSSFGASQAISYSFGSKRAVGYFAAKDGACALTMFLAEAEDGQIAPSAARLSFTVKPGDSAELASVEGHGLQVKCGAGAFAVEIRQTGLSTAAATR